MAAGLLPRLQRLPLGKAMQTAARRGAAAPSLPPPPSTTRFPAPASAVSQGAGGLRVTTGGVSQPRRSRCRALQVRRCAAAAAAPTLTNGDAAEAIAKGPPPAALSAPPFTIPKAALPTASGYLPIGNDGSGGAGGAASKLFYAFYEAEEPARPLGATPVVLWLNGGPGCSSMIGNFYELGPWRVAGPEGQLARNPAPWNRRYGVLFVDNPIGTGFSLAAEEAAIPTDQEGCARHLLSALRALFGGGGPAAHPPLRGRPLVLAGESYAGKYVPSLGVAILRHLAAAGGGRGSDLPFRLIGAAMGNGFTDPRTQAHAPPHPKLQTLTPDPWRA